MMYHATYVPDFYRALHALVHAEFRAGKIELAASRASHRPLDGRPRDHARASRRACPTSRLPGLRAAAAIELARPADRGAPPTPLIPLLTPQAAAVPTDQSSLK